MIFHWLFCIQCQLFLSTMWCILRGSIWIWTKSNLFWFIEGQTHFSTSWDGNVSLTFRKRYRMFIIQTYTLPPSMHRNLTAHGRCCMQNNQLIPEQKSCWVRGWFDCRTLVQNIFIMIRHLGCILRRLKSKNACPYQSACFGTENHVGRGKITMNQATIMQFCNCSSYLTC